MDTNTQHAKKAMKGKSKSLDNWQPCPAIQGYSVEAALAVTGLPTPWGKLPLFLAAAARHLPTIDDWIDFFEWRKCSYLMSGSVVGEYVSKAGEFGILAWLGSVISTSLLCFANWTPTTTRSCIYICNKETNREEFRSTILTWNEWWKLNYMI